MISDYHKMWWSALLNSSFKLFIICIQTELFIVTWSRKIFSSDKTVRWNLPILVLLEQWVTIPWYSQVSKVHHCTWRHNLYKSNRTIIVPTCDRLGASCTNCIMVDRRFTRIICIPLSIKLFTIRLLLTSQFRLISAASSADSWQNLLQLDLTDQICSITHL